MNDVTEFFSRLFSTSEWPPRWKCGYWSDFHGWLYIVSDLLIWAAYFTIPLLIVNFIIKKKANLRFNKAYIYFAAFILLCGATHFLDAAMFWVPMYRVNALLRLATAVVSLATVYHLLKILPQAFQQKTSAELEQEIARRKEAERRLEEANRSLAAFAYIASHDLQEPLRKISTFSGLLLAANEEKFDAKSKDLAAKIISSAGRMRTMITDVLSLSALQDGVTLAPVNTAVAVAAAIESLEMKIAEKAAVISVGPLPPVAGSEAYLTQLFFNLIGNALKFNRQQPVITITGETAGGQVLIHVADNGIGMKEENLQKIFGTFQRLHAKAEYEGSGIGLAICKKIADIHGGSILVKSKPGEGTTFTVALPAAE